MILKFFWLTKLNSQFVFQGIHLDYRALTICSASKNPNFSMDPKSRLGRGGKLLVHTMLAELSDDIHCKHMITFVSFQDVTFGLEEAT